MTPVFPGIIWECQVCHRDNVQRTDQDGFPERIQSCPWCEATARIAAADLPHLAEARRLWLALGYVTSALWRADPTNRLVGRAEKLLAELEHLRVKRDEEAQTDEAPAPGHDLGQGGEHGTEARRLRRDTG
jgi:hypothetical protein